MDAGNAPPQDGRDDAPPPHGAPHGTPPPHGAPHGTPPPHGTPDAAPHAAPPPDGPGAADPAAAVARAIGRRVRAGRAGRGWTLDELARRAGVSRRLLVNVEQGATNPSIATLLRLADALAIALPDLVASDDAPPGAVVVRRAGAAAPMWTGPAGGSAVMAAGSATPDAVELWDWRLGPGDSSASDAHRAGTRELLLVLDGAVELEVDGAVHRLRAGDSASFAADVPHGYRNASTARPARFALAVHEPHAGKDPP